VESVSLDGWREVKGWKRELSFGKESEDVWAEDYVRDMGKWKDEMA